MSRKHARERAKLRQRGEFDLSATLARAWLKPRLVRYWAMSPRRRAKALNALMRNHYRRFKRRHPA